MDYFFIFWFGLFFISFLIGIIFSVYSDEELIGFISLFILFPIASILFIGSVSCFHISSQEKRPAEVIKSFDNIIVKAKGWPQQTTIDYRVLEKDYTPQLIRTVKVNKWGLDEQVEYTCETVKLESN